MTKLVEKTASPQWRLMMALGLALATGGCSDDDDDNGSAALAEPLTVTILHVNDTHSHLQADSFDFDVSELGLTATADDSGTALESVEITYGGFPLLVDQYAELEASAINPIKIHAGDAITGTLYYSLFAGDADAAMMNQICFDAFALGNHEFDDGDSGLASFLTALADDDTCATPVLAANVQPGNNSPVKDMIQPSTVLEIAGQQVGLIGIDIASKTKNSSRPDADTEFLDETETAQQEIDALTAAGVNKIILVTHYGYDNDLAMVANLSGVDVVVGGDSHTLLGGSNLTALGFQPQGDYPTEVTDKDGKPVCVVQAWEYSHVLGQLEVAFDANGDVTSCNGQPLLPIVESYAYSYTTGEGDEAQEEDRTLAGDDVSAVTAALSAYPEIAFGTPDQSTSDLLDSYDGMLDDLAAMVIGQVTEDLCLVRWPGESRSTICDREATYEHGSDISNIVAKAFMAVTPTADVAIQNGGGVRVDVPAGDFTIAKAYELLPFNNTMVTLEMTGQEIVNVLEDALSNTLDDAGSTGSYPYAAGLRFNVDASAEFGSRISNVEVNPRLDGSWGAIDLTAMYSLVTNDFIASGQDGYDAFEPVFAAGKYEDTQTAYAQGLIDFVVAEEAAGRSLARLPAAEYSTQEYIGRDGCNHSESTDCVDF